VLRDRTDVPEGWQPIKDPHQTIANEFKRRAEKNLCILTATPFLHCFLPG